MQTKRILIFNVNWLGDVLFSTAVIRNIKRNYPGSYLACVVPSRCYQVLKDNPHLDEIIIFDEKDRHRGALAKLKFVQLLKSKRFDTAFLLHRSFSRALLCRLAGIPERIGYRTKKRSFLLTKNIKPPKPDSLHRIDSYLNIIEQAGLRVEDRFTEFFLSDSDKEFVEDFLNKKGVVKGDFLVAINPGGNWGPKRWPKEYWARLSDALIKKFKAKVIITGDVSDLALALEIQGLMQAKSIIACGALSLKQLGALCRKTDLFITADTGPLHIANAIGTKRIIALFGPTHPGITGPYPIRNVVIIRKDKGCKIPCYELHCKDNLCMKAITPEDILEAVNNFKA
ncbi:MAG: lipopolysaccharide heptosyltransferase II [Candidatus Omnitrophica bacterium]|nr:lipopolysaccharide heptosyltransferase II [Candidatus Omnitrophota bacterium]